MMIGLEPRWTTRSGCPSGYGIQICTSALDELRSHDIARRHRLVLAVFDQVVHITQKMRLASSIKLECVCVCVCGVCVCVCVCEGERERSRLANLGVYRRSPNSGLSFSQTVHLELYSPGSSSCRFFCVCVCVCVWCVCVCVCV